MRAVPIDIIKKAVIIKMREYFALRTIFSKYLKKINWFGTVLN